MSTLEPGQIPRKQPGGPAEDRRASKKPKPGTEAGKTQEVADTKMPRRSSPRLSPGQPSPLPGDPVVTIHTEERETDGTSAQQTADDVMETAHATLGITEKEEKPQPTPATEPKKRTAEQRTAEPKRNKQSEEPSTEVSEKTLTDKDVTDILDKKQFTDELRTSIIEKYNEIKKNYPSFETAKTPEGLLTDSEMLNIAIHIVTVLPRIKEATNLIFETGQTDHVLHKTGLARDILITKEGSFLLPDHELSKIKGEGTFKLASSIMTLYTNLKDTNPEYVLLKTKEAAEMEEPVRAKTLQEGEIQRSLSGEQGIAKCHSVINYANGQIGFLVEKMHGDLHDFLFKKGDPGTTTQKTKTTLDTKQQITAMSDITAGLRAIHEKGIVHGDIKGENILFIVDENGKIVKVGITDFGLSFYIKPGEQNQWSKSKEFRVGIYGTVGYTAPELFGEHEKFDGDFDKFSKTDVWAAGMVLYQMHFQKDPPWKMELNKIHNRLFNIKEDRYRDIPIVTKQLTNFKVRFNDIVTKEIEGIKDEDGNIIKEGRRDKVLSKSKEDRTVEDEIELLICDMLTLDPDKRITAADAEERVRLIEQKRAQSEDQNMPVDSSGSDESQMPGEVSDFDEQMQASPPRQLDTQQVDTQQVELQAEQPEKPSQPPPPQRPKRTRNKR